MIDKEDKDKWLRFRIRAKRKRIKLAERKKDGQMLKGEEFECKIMRK